MAIYAKLYWRRKTFIEKFHCRSRFSSWTKSWCYMQVTDLLPIQKVRSTALISWLAMFWWNLVTQWRTKQTQLDHGQVVRWSYQQLFEVLSMCCDDVTDDHDILVWLQIGIDVFNGQFDHPWSNCVLGFNSAVYIISWPKTRTSKKRSIS